MVAGFGAAALGHGNPDLSRALHDAASSSRPGIVPWGITAETGKLAARLCARSQKFEKVHFASSGAEAVDSALKFAAAVTGRSEFVALSGGFHGLTVAATGLSAGVWADPYPQIWPNIVHAPSNDYDTIRTVLSKRRAAAIVLEIIQGTGHAMPLGAESLLRIAEIARSVGTLVIVDEVQTGLGRTGEWFASSIGGASFAPDMLILSKALTGGLIPISAVLMTQRVFDAVFADRARAKIHGSTLSGGRLAAACATAVIDVLERDNLVAAVRRKGTLFEARLRALQDRGFVSNFRGKGLLWALEISSSQDSGERLSLASAACIGLMERGVFTSIAGHDLGSIRVSPPFVITPEEIEFFFGALEETMTEILQ